MSQTVKSTLSKFLSLGLRVKGMFRYYRRCLKPWLLIAIYSAIHSFAIGQPPVGSLESNFSLYMLGELNATPVVCSEQVISYQICAKFSGTLENFVNLWDDNVASQVVQENYYIPLDQSTNWISGENSTLGSRVRVFRFQDKRLWVGMSLDRPDEEISLTFFPM